MFVAGRSPEHCRYPILDLILPTTPAAALLIMSLLHKKTLDFASLHPDVIGNRLRVIVFAITERLSSARKSSEFYSCRKAFEAGEKLDGDSV